MKRIPPLYVMYNLAYTYTISSCNDSLIIKFIFIFAKNLLSSRIKRIESFTKTIFCITATCSNLSKFT